MHERPYRRNHAPRRVASWGLYKIGSHHSPTQEFAMLPGLAVVFIAIPLSAIGVNGLENGVGRLPALGYNTWNAYQCNIDENLMLTTAQLMKSLGLQAAGYNYVNIDDCYAERNRSASGDIIADKVRFKSGMKTLTDKIHALGFKTGIYSDSGWFTCAGYPGSFQNELRDARTFQDWGFDYLKYDNCAIPYDSIIKQGIVGKYQRMADALAQLSKTTGKRPFLFSLCEWGWSQVWQ
ncbi:hypothetical protein HGRIS_011249 [Hohenbuehelia grisea]|uniref:Alpha-galactosidase n=1 Tax=Hohenbuehelia grisea TaxID=104357 RepID=A0ABR3JUM3_9AGAR